MIKQYFNLKIVLFLVLFSCNNKNEEVKEYYDGSKEKIKYSYYKESSEPNLKNGLFTEYYPNGKVKEECEYHHGLPWKIINQYTPDGKKINKSSLVDGKGSYYRYNIEGELILKQEYFQGLPDGMAILYNNQKEIASLSYFQGVLDDTDIRSTFSLNIGDDSTLVENGKNTSDFKSFDKSSTDLILEQLKNKRYSQYYESCFSKFKQAQNFEATKKHLEYIHDLYGPIKSYNMNSYNLKSQAGIGEGMQVIYDCKFAYCQGQIIMLLFKEKDHFRSAGISFQVKDYTPIIQLTKVGDPIIENIKAKKFDFLYDNASARFHQAVQKSDFIQQMEQIDQLGTIQQFQLYQHEVGVLDNTLVAILFYEINFSKGESVIFELNMSQIKGKLVLEGLNMQQMPSSPVYQP